LSVISTGIGPDNIDIVLNELDALVNIDFETREIKATKTSLSIMRIGTSGALQPDIDIDSFVLSAYGMDINGMLQSYKIDAIKHADIEAAFVAHTQWSPQKPYPVIIQNSKRLEAKLKSEQTINGLTATCGGFYGPQGRVLRLELQDDSLNHKMDSFEYNGLRVTNFEMETSAIYGLSKLLGHEACSMNAILANRALGTFSKNPQATIEKLIIYTLNKLIS
jgi:uridine phosphorylase